MKIKLPTLSRVSFAMLKYGFWAVLATLIYIAFALSSLDAYDTARLVTFFTSQLEHAAMALLLVVCGALLFDIAVREKR